MVVLVLYFVLPLFTSDREVVGSSMLLPFSGTWVGEINGVGTDFSANLELKFDKRCSIGDLCGSYRIIDSVSNDDLELISVNNNVFKFRDHSKEDELLEGSGQQSMRLVGDTLNWSFEQTLPSGEEYKSKGVFTRK